MLRTFLVRLARNVTPVLQNNTRRAFVTTSVQRKTTFDQAFKDAKEVELKIESTAAIGVTSQSGVVAEDPGVTELEIEESITQKYVEFFENVDNDGWLARNAMNDLMQHAFVPEPEVTIAVMHSCRRMNDYALAVRYLESLKHMLAVKVDEIWPWYLQEIKPTLDELGIQSPEDMGFDKPEYFLPNVDDIHGYGREDLRALVQRKKEERQALKAELDAIKRGEKSA